MYQRSLNKYQRIHQENIDKRANTTAASSKSIIRIINAPLQKKNLNISIL